MADGNRNLSETSVGEYLDLHYKAKNDPGTIRTNMDREEKWVEKLLRVLDYVPFDSIEAVYFDDRPLPGTIDYINNIITIHREYLDDHLLVHDNQENAKNFLKANPKYIWYTDGDEEKGMSSWLICRLVQNNFDASIFPTVVDIVNNYARDNGWSNEETTKVLRTMFETRFPSTRSVDTPIELWAKNRYGTTEDELRRVEQLIRFAPSGMRILTRANLSENITYICHYGYFDGQGQRCTGPYSQYKREAQSRHEYPFPDLLPKLEFVIRGLRELGVRMEEIFTDKLVRNIAFDLDEFMGPSLIQWIVEYPLLLQGLEKYSKNKTQLRLLKSHLREMEYLLTINAYQELVDVEDEDEGLVPAMMGVVTENTRLHNWRADLE